MDRAPAVPVDPSLRASLRANPIFAGVPDETLDQIARLVSASSVRKISDSLRKVQLFEGISEEDALRIQEVGRAVTLAAGETLFEEGKKGETFYVVLRGRIELFKRGRDGGEQKLAVAREGEAFGEMALLNQSPRSATARALEESHLLEISRAAFDSLLGADSFPVRMLRGISKALWAMSVRFASHQGAAGDPRAVLRGVSHLMQGSVIPPGLPHVPGFSVMAATHVSEKGEGDSAWDCFRLGDGRFALVALRAGGEGHPAGSALILARTLLREIGRDHPDPRRLLARVNDAWVGIPGTGRTVACALVTMEDGKVTWSGAGPVPAAVVRRGGAVMTLTAGGPALGAERGATFRSVSVPMKPGDVLVSVAGGLPDALDRARAALAERGPDDLGDVAKRLASLMPVEDPVTGEAFEHTILLLKSGTPGDATPAPGAEREEVVRSPRKTSATR